MSQQVEFPDIELALKPYLRDGLAEWAADISQKFPATNWTPGHWVVVRDDGGPTVSLVTQRRRVGFTCIGADYKTTRRMADRVAALLHAAPEASTLPIADALVRSPYSLDATKRVEFYLSADLVVVGHTVTL
jgi:hypothetical protein